jgi:dTDP-4-dehydrorhamnose 3,5-epimerase
MPFSFKQLEIPGTVVIDTKKFSDERGEFLESYKDSEFEQAGLGFNFKQDNFSQSSKGVLRGMHYQLEPKAQGKLVRVLFGKILDVVVDLRKNSPTFKQWLMVELSAENAKALYVPVGCAHGFLCLEENNLVLYKTTEEYSPEHERGIVWNDPVIGIKWPNLNPVVSSRDLNLPLFEQAEIFNTL